MRGSACIQINHMNTTTTSDQTIAQLSAGQRAATRIPLALKLTYTGFMAVLVPVYWYQYGPTNFLYFCDLALFFTLAAVWLENSLLASMAAVGIILPQLLWCGDFVAHLAGLKLLGMTDYMFDSHRSKFLRGLSCFHGWLPFLLLFLVKRLGYDRRALPAWTAVAWVSMVISYCFLPAPGTKLSNPLAPVNVDYVFGLSDAAAQTWLPGWLWFGLLLVALPVLILLPSHWFLDWFAGRKATKFPSPNVQPDGKVQRLSWK